MQKNETILPSYTTNKNMFKMDQRLKYQTQHINILEENIGSKILVLVAIFFSDISPQVRETKEKNKQLGLHQTKKVLHSKGNHQQNKKKIH